MNPRHIIIRDEDEIREDFWCDAIHCTKCPLRFQCYTTDKDTIKVTYPTDEIEEFLHKFNTQRWRLRDGSSEKRKRRDLYM